MKKNKAHAPCLTVYDPPKTPDLRKNCLYTRYPFTAEAKISSSAAVMLARVTNISFGGCRLLTDGRVPVGDALTITINSPNDSFEATTKVVHSTENEAGVIFDEISPQSLFVLQKWISAAKLASTVPKPRTPKDLSAQSAGRKLR
jgi:hypothetical protein